MPPEVRLNRALLFCSALLLCGSIASAQEALQPGRRALSVDLPSGGGSTFGLWQVRSETGSRGLLLSLDLQAGESSSNADTNGQSIAVAAGPAFKRYFSESSNVRPFIRTSAMAGGTFTRNEFVVDSLEQSQHQWSVNATLGAGIGAEWFAVERLSVAAHTGGLSGGYARAKAPDGTETRTASNWSVRLRTLTSALTVQFYF